MKNSRGITLVALVMTVIILLILAGVAISAITGGENLFGKTKEAAEKYNNASEEEKKQLEEILKHLNVPNLTYENVKFESVPQDWTNKSVKVSIKTELEGYILQYSIDKGNTWKNYTDEIEINNNGEVILARLENNGITGGVASYTIFNIDKLSPKVFEINAENVTASEFNINAITTDTEETAKSGNSGVKNYIYYIKKASEETYYNATVLNNSYSYSNLSSETEYNVYVEVYDNAGNSTKSNIITVKTDKADVPATEKSELGNYVKYNGGGYTNWRVLYNDGNNISLVSVGNVENKYFYGTSSYNNCVSQLNSIANKYNDGIYCESARSVNKDDYYPMKTISANAIGSHYWLSNNYYVETPYLFPPNITLMKPSYMICFITANGVPGGALNTTIIESPESSLGATGATVNFWGETNYGFTFGVRVVVKLKHGVKIVSGTGISTDPYILGV